MYEYEGVRRKVYSDGTALIPVCQLCRRFVKADDVITINGLGELVDEPNATCTRCGRVQMPAGG